MCIWDRSKEVKFNKNKANVAKDGSPRANNVEVRGMVQVGEPWLNEAVVEAMKEFSK